MYAISDISLTRGSATSLAEQQIFGIKKIIIPLPFTGGNHQFYNALQYNTLYEDIIVEQNEHMKENIATFIRKLYHDKKHWETVDEKQILFAKETIWEKLLAI